MRRPRSRRRALARPSAIDVRNRRKNVLSDGRIAEQHAGMSTRQRRIGVVLYEGVTALDVVGPADAFACATLPARSRSRAAEAAYEVVTIGVKRGTCVCESGMVVRPSHAMADAPALDTLIVPGGRGLREPSVNRHVADWIRARARRTRRIASVCTGIYGLAPTGLLDGRRVTTHWRHADDVAARFPELRVEPDAIFVKDGSFYTSAGVTAGIDLALALIEEDLGAAASLAVARELVVYVRRSGGQAQFSEPLQFQSHAPDRFSDLLGYIAGHLDQDLSVEALARRMAISPRQLSRQCKQALGSSPGAIAERMRLDEAKERLLRRGTTVESVALSVGFRTADVFRRAFERRFGLTPTAYRSHFQRSRGST